MVFGGQSIHLVRSGLSGWRNTLQRMGFLSNVFLPRITYGRQCPDSGWADAATLSRGGGYTHYRRCRSSLQVVSRSRRIYPVGLLYRKLATFSETLRWVGAV
jgi:hypothetical protein